MKKLLIALMLVTGASPVFAVDDAMQSYISIELGSMSAVNLCPGYSVVEGGMLKIGDQLGVDDDVGIAVGESIKMMMGMDYDRTRLIPQVTRMVQRTIDELLPLTQNKKKFCKDYAPILLERGTIRRGSSKGEKID